MKDVSVDNLIEDYQSQKSKRSTYRAFLEKTTRPKRRTTKMLRQLQQESVGCSPANAQARPKSIKKTECI